ncbi:hypothetical protein GGQ88_002347 [Novosphingobium hassiacum]|uniref:Uncharacterized protein n=1 Tax=Novosphingobium hassiacum TaxID=173676 RepID=A0A7W6A0M2_9SPHN|nr:hypothetical protein [Novosphingobium hassiacum]MBB3861075.1 hypothetical protein [Novosphingobium hassiacum]
MVEERVETRDPDGVVHTRTTVYDEGARRSGGSGWVVVLLVLLVLVVGGYFLLQAQDSRSSRDNAIAEAASDVGSAAKQVGNAAQDAVDSDKK